MSDALPDQKNPQDIADGTPAGGLPRRALLKGTAGILATGMFPAVRAWLAARGL